MYDFTSPTERGYHKYLATEALIWNGVVIDNEIKGFRTLAVEGRENVSRETITMSRPQDGDIELGSSVVGKTIKILFSIVSTNSRDFNNSWYQLKKLVRGEKQPFNFADEQDFVRYGTIRAITNETVGTFSSKGSIEIYMSDPFSYAPSRDVKIFANGVEPLLFEDDELTVPQRPTSLELVFNVGVGSPDIVFTNDATGERYHLQATIQVKSGDKLGFSFDQGVAYLNDRKQFNAISIGSDMGSFKLSTGMKINNENSMLRSVNYKYSAKRL